MSTLLAQEVAGNGGWIGFDRFMQLALYAPGVGYYAADDRQFGNLPAAAGGPGGDFTTAPEISPYFGRALAVQLAEALARSGTDEIWEFGAGSGALAEQLLHALGDGLRRYTIVDVSGALRQRQKERLRPFGDKVSWAAAQLPDKLRGVVVGNEVLDAMPVRLLVRLRGAWHERGVALDADGRLCWQDRPTGLRPPVEVVGEHDYLTEVHPQAEGFMRLLADRLEQGAVVLIDYGFPEREYYHPQRSGGTVMCHRAHQSDADPLADVGAKDITAHVNFTGLALAAQDADEQPAPGRRARGTWHLLGYTTQARFLINCGLPAMLEGATLAQRTMAQKLLMEHEMGELFKVIAFCRGEPWDAVGFAVGDRSHTL